MAISNDLTLFLPLVTVVAWAVLLLLADLFIPQERKGITALLAAAGLAVALGVCILRGGQEGLAFSGMARMDGFARFLNLIFLVSGLAAVALAHDYLKRMQIERGEYYVLLMFSIAGMMLMSVAADLIMVFLALEMLSIPLYVLAGFAHPRLDSEEAALKYFLLGAFSSAFVLFGIALIFGSTSFTSFQGVVGSMVSGHENTTLLATGAGLLLVGFAFKVGAVPFHMWTPDVYQGAPSPVSAFMSVGAKAAGFAGLLRVFFTALPAVAADLTPVFWGLAALTMVVGNVAAVIQTNIKRLLAYSSIAHAGYILMAFVPAGVAALQKEIQAAALFYLAAYALTSLGAWAVVVAVEQEDGKGLLIEDLAGLGRKHPWLGAAMTVFMLSFTGVPPTLGFWGKFYLFRTALVGGYTWLAVIGVLASLVSAYYYLRVVVVIFFKPGEPLLRRDFWVELTAAVTALAVAGLAFFPGPLFDLAARAVMRLQ